MFDANNLSYYNKEVGVHLLVGKTLTKVENKDNKELLFYCNDGEVYRMFHYQDCCEYVRIEDVCGELDDLVGSEILVAREDDNLDAPKPEGEYVDSYTWTFYNLATNKGWVTLRWLGESNGYYSESVDFEKVE